MTEDELQPITRILIEPEDEKENQDLFDEPISIFTSKEEAYYKRHQRLREKLADTPYSEILEFIDKFPKRKRFYNEYLKLLDNFVWNYVKIRKDDEAYPPYKPRKDIIPERGRLSIGMPALQSLSEELLKPDTEEPLTIAFLLDSYIFIMKRRHIWDAIYMFTLGNYADMNTQISKRDFTKDQNLRILYESMLDPLIPLAPSTMDVYRCTTSTSNFDVVNFKSFSTYRLTSVTRDSAIRTCLASNDGNEVVKMIITPMLVPGLFIGFKHTSHHVNEREILLCPGIRFQVVPKWLNPVPEGLITSILAKKNTVALNEFHQEETWADGRTTNVYFKRYLATLVKVDEHFEHLKETLPTALKGFDEFQNLIREKQIKEWIQQRVDRVKQARKNKELKR